MPEANDYLESEEFYNLMQNYRNAFLVPQEAVIEAFEAVKSFIRSKQSQEASNAQ